MEHWYLDWTTWIYSTNIALALWGLALSILEVIKRNGASPVFYYIMLLLLSIILTDIFNLHTRLGNPMLWGECPEGLEKTYRNLTSFSWAARNLPATIGILLIDVDFTMRKFLNKRLFNNAYKGIEERRK